MNILVFFENYDAPYNVLQQRITFTRLHNERLRRSNVRQKRWETTGGISRIYFKVKIVFADSNSNDFSF